MDKLFPPTNPNIRYDEFQKILKKSVKVDEELETALQASDINPDLSSQQREQLLNVLRASASAIAIKGKQYEFGQLGETLKLNAQIPTPVPKELRKAPYPLSNKARADTRSQIDVLLANGLIRPSRSPYAAPTLIVYRGDKARMFQDYRVMNTYIKAPAYPLPNLLASIQNIPEAEFMTSIDLNDGFYNMVLSEDFSIPLTAFVTPDGFYEWLRAGFGIPRCPLSSRKE